MQTIYDFQALQFNGHKKSLQDYSGKVLLIVNTASRCVFTSQYKSLEALYQKYKDRGFEILAFPSNDFHGQEPMTGLQLETYCRIQQQVTFSIFKRIHVIGDYCDPLYRFLADSNQNGHVNGKPLWNFHKYLINSQGEVVDYFYSTTSPIAGRLQKRIEDLLP